MESVALTPMMITNPNTVWALVICFVLVFIGVIVWITLRSRQEQGEDAPIFQVMPQPDLAERLARAMNDTVAEFSAGPGSYLRAALLPDHIEQWFPVTLAKLIGTSMAHPAETMHGALAADPIDTRRRRRFVTVLSLSAAVHGALVIYLIYLAFFSQFANMHVVDRAYRKFDPNRLTEKLYYPPQMLRLAPRGPAMTLEEIRARSEKHKHEIALAREKAEKEKREKEEADRKAAEAAAKAEEAAKVADQNKPAAASKLSDINIAPIKDTVSNLYKLFDAGGLDMPEVRFSMMAGFKVMPDGSFEHIRIIKSSGSKVIDTNALEILSNIGESHALGQVAVLSSPTITLEITDDVARIRIMAFAPTPEIAKEKSDLLNVLFWALRMKEKSPDLGQLLKLIKVKSDGKRVDTDLVVPRARAAEMFRAWSARPSTPPQ